MRQSGRRNAREPFLRPAATFAPSKTVSCLWRIQAGCLRQCVGQRKASSASRVCCPGRCARGVSRQSCGWGAACPAPPPWNRTGPKAARGRAARNPSATLPRGASHRMGRTGLRIPQVSNRGAGMKLHLCNLGGRRERGGMGCRVADKHRRRSASQMKPARKAGNSSLRGPTNSPRSTPCEYARP